MLMAVVISITFFATSEIRLAVRNLASLLRRGSPIHSLICDATRSTSIPGIDTEN
jgi:hypothetical protein